MLKINALIVSFFKENFGMKWLVSARPHISVTNYNMYTHLNHKDHNMLDIYMHVKSYKLLMLLFNFGTLLFLNNVDRLQRRASSVLP